MKSNLLEKIGTSLQKKVLVSQDLLSKEDISSLKGIFQDRRYSLAAAQELSDNSENIIAQIVDCLGPTLNQDEIERFKSFLDLFLRAISYALVAGDKEPIDEYVLNGFHEFVYATNQSMNSYVDAMEYVKSHACLRDGVHQKLEEYVQYTIDALLS